MDDELRALEEYFPQIDPALIHALYPDYAPNGIEVLRSILDGMKHDALAEQMTEFDASGSSGPVGEESGEGAKDGGSEDRESNAESWASQTTVTDFTGTARKGRSVLSSAGSSEGDRSREMEALDTPTKEVLLAETFPTLRLELITHTLKKCDCDFAKATDELLNHVYFEDLRASPSEEMAPRGIDAFSDEFHVPKRGRRGKRNKKQKEFHDASPPFISETDSPQTNRWNDGERDINFLVENTRMERKVLASLYHKSGASLAATILTIIRNDISLHAKDGEPDASLVHPALELIAESTNIDLDYAIALIRLTEPWTSNAHELAKALTVYPGTTPLSTVDLKIIPRYAPLNLSEPTSECSTSELPVLPPSATPWTTASIAASRSSAFEQASVAYRRGRSDPLHRAVATYYSQIGRDAHSHLLASHAADADALVSAQSTATVLDLHFVDVKSATRIAKERTRAWWQGLGERRIPGSGRGGGGGDVGEGYRIVTGVGRHSEGGRGKLGPAVYRALWGEGWKVVVGEGGGELVVWGRRKM